MFPSNTNSLFAAIFCSYLSVCISKKLPPPPEPNASSLASLYENSTSLVNETLQMNLMERAAQAALQIGQLFHNYTIHLPNATDSKGSSLGKKGYAQQQNNDGYYQLSAGEFDIRSVVPYLVDNVISPLLKRFFIEQNAFTLFGGGSSASEHPPKEQPSAQVENEQGRKTPPTPTITMTTKPTTTENVGRDLLDDNNNVPSAVVVTTTTPAATTTTTTTSKPKYKVRERTSPPSTVSTRKPYVADEDDEDESGIFNKIKHL